MVKIDDISQIATAFGAGQGSPRYNFDLDVNVDRNGVRVSDFVTTPQTYQRLRGDADKNTRYPFPV
jgi:hypothetical protein